MKARNKVVVAAIWLGILELLVAAGYFAYRSLIGPTGVFTLKGGRGAQSLESVDHYLALLCFIGALALIAFVKNYRTQKNH